MPIKNVPHQPRQDQALEQNGKQEGSQNRSQNRRFAKPIISGLALLIGALIISGLVVQPVTVSALLTQPAVPGFSIKYLAVGVWEAGDIATWTSANHATIYDIHPDNSLNIIEICVTYDETRILDANIPQRYIYLDLTIDNGEVITHVYPDYIQHNAGQNEVIYRETGLNYEIDIQDNYIIALTYSVVIL